MSDVSDEQLRVAVAGSRSWRGVLRALGMSSPRTGRELKARCEVLGVDYSHFRNGPSDETVIAAVAGAHTWIEAVVAAGYSRDSGSARAQLRRRSAALGIDTAHLSAGPAAVGSPLHGPAMLHNLRAAAAMLVSAALTLAGHRCIWPLEPAPYDLLVDASGSIQRVQVKSTTTRPEGSWQCMLTRSTYDGLTGRQVRDVYTADEIDTFAIVDGDLGIYLIPFEAVAGMTGISLRKYEAYRLPGWPPEAVVPA